MCWSREAIDLGSRVQFQVALQGLNTAPENSTSLHILFIMSTVHPVA